MYHVIVDKDKAFEFVSDYFAYGRTDQQKGLVLTKDDVTLAAVIYDDYNGSNIFMHVAAAPGRKWLNRHFLHESFKYPFVTLGCKRITGWVEADNLDAQRFNEHLGFKREAILKSAGANGQDVYIYAMFREDCRYA